MVDTCHHTQSDYQVSNPPPRQTGWVRGLRMICHTTNNPAPSISTVSEGAHVVALSLSPPSPCVGGAMQPWIRLVALADMWTDSCHKMRKTIVLCRPVSLFYPWAVPDWRAVNPISLFCALVCYNGYQWHHWCWHRLTSKQHQCLSMSVRYWLKNTPRWDPAAANDIPE